MNVRLKMLCCVVVAASSMPSMAQTTTAAATVPDDRLAAARRYVEQSPRFLHHSKVTRGMKGYGLTVLSGTKPVKFQVEIVSVLTRWGPHQDTILARLSGQGLDKSKVISGMSGSPVYVTDPRDGKSKLIGAVAYGWRGQVEPLCGLQPITQMLAIHGALPGDKAAPAAKAAAAAAAPAQAPREFLRAVLNPRKVDFAGFTWPRRQAVAARGAAAGALRPLSTPLMVAGARGRLLEALRSHLAPTGLTPFRSGGLGGIDKRQAAAARLEPGSGISIPLVSGDADWSAVGTVTDVTDDRVLAFGHAFFGRGDMAMPMGPAYVHTVVSSINASFKLSSSLPPSGALIRDERVGVLGAVGRRVSTIPMKVTLVWKEDGRTQTFRYNVCRHRSLTPMIVSMLVQDSAWGWRELPEYHTVRYAVAVDFGKFGRYRSANVTSGNDIYHAASDASRPVAALLNSPLGKPPKLESIDVEISIETGLTVAEILDFKLDASEYRPGETVTGALTIRRFRRERQKLAVSFALPDNLPEGPYVLTACDATTAMRDRMREMPQLFNPRTNAQLLATMQRVVQPKSTDLYLRLPLASAGLALGTGELPDLPPSRAGIIKQARQLDTRDFSAALVRTVPTQYVLSGRASQTLTVRKRPRQTPTRRIKK